MYSSDYFEFFSPVKIISGEHALSTLNYELDRLHVSKPLILTNQSLDEMKILDTLLSHLKNDSINQRQIIKTIPNQATIEIVKKASQRYKDLESNRNTS